MKHLSINEFMNKVKVNATENHLYACNGIKCECCPYEDICCNIITALSCEINRFVNLIVDTYNEGVKDGKSK